MIQPETYQRKPFDVTAIRVTAENMDDVAAWCRGSVHKPSRPGDLARHIKVAVSRARNERQTQAYVGDWVLYANGFKVYTDTAFWKTFDKRKNNNEVQQDDNIDNYGTYPGYESMGFDETLVGPNCD